MHVCEKCANLSKNCCTFKQSGLENVDKFNKMCFRKKRLVNTPPSALKLKIKESVAEKLIKSVDKMRQLDLNDSRAPKTQKKSKVKLGFSDISNDKNSTTNTSLFSGKSDTLYDHGYSVSKDKSIDILASPTWPVDISETLKDIFFDHGYSSVSKDKDISVSPLPVEN